MEVETNEVSEGWPSASGMNHTTLPGHIDESESWGDGKYERY